MGRKYYAKKWFDFCGYKFECQTQDTNYGFRHVCTMYDSKMNELSHSKRCYYNRTWEKYTYQSVISDCIAKWDGSVADKLAVHSMMENYEEPNSTFNIVGTIAMFGNLFSHNRKECNDWKLRMLRADLETSGLSIPEDWETLTEDEKTKRLDLVINELRS